MTEDNTSYLSLASVLVRRHGALGDVLLTTPVVSRLRKILGPHRVIDVETGNPGVFHDNPHVNTVHNYGSANPANYSALINLDMAYELKPHMHVVDAYMSYLPEHPMPYSKRVVFAIDPPPPRELITQSRVIAIHAAKSWDSRTLPVPKWNVILHKLIEQGFKISMLGHGADYGGFEHPAITNLVGKCDLRQTANNIASSMCLIATDSSLIHLVGCTDTPLVGIFTCVKAEYRLPYRKNILGWRCAAVYPQIECYGCLKDVPAPATGLTCKRGDNECTNLIRHEDVLAQVRALIGE